MMRGCARRVLGLGEGSEGLGGSAVWPWPCCAHRCSRRRCWQGWDAGETQLDGSTFFQACVSVSLYFMCFYFLLKARCLISSMKNKALSARLIPPAPAKPWSALKNKQAVRDAAAFSPRPSLPHVPRCRCWGRLRAEMLHPLPGAEGRCPLPASMGPFADLCLPFPPRNFPCFGQGLVAAKGGGISDTSPSCCVPLPSWEDAGGCRKEPGAFSVPQHLTPSTHERDRSLGGYGSSYRSICLSWKQRGRCLRDENTSSAAPPPPDIWESGAAAPWSFPALFTGAMTQAARRAERREAAAWGRAGSGREPGEEPSPAVVRGTGCLSRPVVPDPTWVGCLLACRGMGSMGALSWWVLSTRFRWLWWVPRAASPTGEVSGRGVSAWCSRPLAISRPLQGQS